MPAPRLATDLGWRSFFSDPRLQGLIEQSLDYNRDLRVAVARVEEARAQYGITRAERFPALLGNARATRTRSPSSLSFGNQPSLFSRYDLQVSVPAFELDFFGRVRNLADAALARYLATEEAARAAHIALVGEVAGTYLTQLELAQRIALAKKALGGREASLKLVSRRGEVGLASDLELHQAEGLTASARAELANLRRLYAQTGNALRFLTGNAEAELPPPQTLAEQGAVLDLPAGLPADVLIQRPDIQSAEQALIASHADIGAARAAFFPRITLTANAGYASRELDNLVGSNNEAWSFIPQLSLPLFQAGVLRANLDLAQARRNTAVADYERSIQQAFREVADALADRRYLAEQLQELEAVRRAQDARLKLADARHRSGITPYLEVLDAERELFAAEQAEVQVRSQLLAVGVSLYRALGGGLVRD